MAGETTISDVVEMLRIALVNMPGVLAVDYTFESARDNGDPYTDLAVIIGDESYGVTVHSGLQYQCVSESCVHEERYGDGRCGASNCANYYARWTAERRLPPESIDPADPLSTMWAKDLFHRMYVLHREIDYPDESRDRPVQELLDELGPIHMEVKARYGAEALDLLAEYWTASKGSPDDMIEMATTWEGGALLVELAMGVHKHTPRHNNRGRCQCGATTGW